MTGSRVSPKFVVHHIHSSSFITRATSTFLPSGHNHSKLKLRSPQPLPESSVVCDIHITSPAAKLYTQVMDIQAEQSYSLLRNDDDEDDQETYAGSSEKDAFRFAKESTRQRPYTSITGSIFEVVSKASCCIERVFNFLSPQCFKTAFCQPQPSLHATSYLDGLRGVAAFIVAITHYTNTFFPSMQFGFGYGPPKVNNYIFQLPFLRVIHAGAWMVPVFFVISGYVLSHKALRFAQQRRYDAFLDAMGSAVFRRWIRLMLPVASVMIIQFLFARVDLFHFPIKNWNIRPQQGEESGVERRQYPVPIGGFFEQLLDLCRDLRAVADPFGFETQHQARFDAGGVLWTIPVEFTGSMVVFLIVCGIGKIRGLAKIGILFGLVLYALVSAHLLLALFIAGVFLADLSILRTAQQALLPSNNAPIAPSYFGDCFKDVMQSFSLIWQYLSPLCKTGVLLLSIYAGAMPYVGAETTPGYITLLAAVPSSYNKALMLRCISAIVLVACLEYTPTWQRPFTTRFAQYLGTISFSFYLIHYTILLSFSTWLIPRSVWIANRMSNADQSGLAFALAVSCSWSVCWILTFWIADIHTRLVDVRSVRFAAWLKRICWVRD